MNKSLLFRSISIGCMSVMVLCLIAIPQTIHAEPKNVKNDVTHTLVHNGHLTICKLDKSSYHVVRTIKKAVVTAYSSSWDETTGIPGKPGLITASGKGVADGVIAYNHLPFGTKLRMNIPGLEDKIFVVEDRTAAGRKNLDIWMPSKQEALNFGAQVVAVEIIES